MIIPEYADDDHHEYYRIMMNSVGPDSPGLSELGTRNFGSSGPGRSSLPQARSLLPGPGCIATVTRPRPPARPPHTQGQPVLAGAPAGHRRSEA
eukprot:297689-Hanusia_phi.AAC.1